MEAESNGIVKMPDLDYVPDPRGLGYVYYESMLKNKNKVGQVSFPKSSFPGKHYHEQIEGLTGKKDTFGELLERAIRMALNLEERGLRPGDMVTACTHNHLNSGIPLIAAMFLGATVSHLDPSMSLKEIMSLIKQVMPKILFVQQDSAEHIKNILNAIGCNAQMIVFGVDDLLPPHPHETDFRPHTVRSLQQTAVVAFSSGTTGYPKGICLNHYSIMCQVANKTDGLDHDSALITTYSTPYWSVSICIMTLNIIKGITRLVYPKFEPVRMWEMFQYKVTYALINVGQMSQMCKVGRPEHLNTDSLIDIQICGDTVSEAKMMKMRSMFPNVRVHLIYGQTEIPMSITLFDVCNKRDLEFIRQKPTSVGTGMYGMAYKIVNVDSGKILGPNQRGELRVKTDFQTNGYLNHESSCIWDSDGWLKTGDIAYYDHDRCFYIVGRLKEMFKFREWHVIPTVLEDILVSHPAIENVAVIGVPHDIDSHHPMALVVLKPSHENTREEEIENFVEEQVHDTHRLRGGVMIVPKLPVTATGKINRNKLGELYL